MKRSSVLYKLTKPVAKQAFNLNASNFLTFLLNIPVQKHID